MMPTQANPNPGSAALELTVVIPCLNEVATVGRCVEKAVRTMQEHGISGEVVVADNGSSDGSQEIAVEEKARLVHVPVKGYGAALMGGIAEARGKYVIMGDADDSYDFAALDPFVDKLREGYDLVMGNRFEGGIRPGAMPLLHQYLGNPVLSTLGRLFFRSGVGDFHCGLRGFKRQAVLDLDLRTTGMEYASEMVVKASLQGLKIAEVPVVLYPDGRSRRPHLRTWRDGWRHLRFLLLYSPRWLFLYPGLLLMFLGMIVGVWLMPGPRSVGNIILDINTLFYAALAVLIGFQSVNFAVLTRIFAIGAGLLPESPPLTRILQIVTLEKGLLLGSIMVFVGLVGSLAALIYWQTQSFGPLDPSVSFRIVIPGGTFLAIGFQVILSSFFLSILGLSRR